MPANGQDGQVMVGSPVLQKLRLNTASNDLHIGDNVGFYNSQNNTNLVNNSVEATTSSEVDTVGSLENSVDYSGDGVIHYVFVINLLNVLYIYPNNEGIDNGFYMYEFSFQLQKYILCKIQLYNDYLAFSSVFVCYRKFMCISYADSEMIHADNIRNQVYVNGSVQLQQEKTVFIMNISLILFVHRYLV